MTVFPSIKIIDPRYAHYEYLKLFKMLLFCLSINEYP